jgi:hypothetical protein
MPRIIYGFGGRDVLDQITYWTCGTRFYGPLFGVIR